MPHRLNRPGEKKKEFGQVLNEFKQLAESTYENWKSRLDSGVAGPAQNMDLSLPGDELPLGTHHPITLVRNRIVHIFGRLGFPALSGGIPVIPFDRVRHAGR